MSLYRDTRFNGKLVRLEDVIDEIYELLENKDDEEFYMDYKEAFPLIVEKLQKFHNVED